MKVGAVAPLRVASPESVAVSPAGAGLVVAHVGQRVLVERACLLHLRHLRLYLLCCNLRRESANGDELVRFEKPAKTRSRGGNGSRGIHQVLMADYVIFHAEVVLGLVSLVSVRI